MISRDILTFTEAKTIDAMGRIEDTIDKNRVKIEVRFHVII